MTSYVRTMDLLDEVKCLAEALHLVNTHQMIDCYQKSEPGFAVLKALLSKIEHLEAVLKEAKEMQEEEREKFEKGFAYKPKKKYA